MVTVNSRRIVTCQNKASYNLVGSYLTLVHSFLNSHGSHCNRLNHPNFTFLETVAQNLNSPQGWGAPISCLNCSRFHPWCSVQLPRSSPSQVSSLWFYCCALCHDQKHHGGREFILLTLPSYVFCFYIGSNQYINQGNQGSSLSEGPNLGDPNLW